jgi:hypothetical protein
MRLSAPGARIQHMFMRLRAWWCERFVKREKWSPGVGEYIIRQGWKDLARARKLSPETQEEVSKNELVAVLSDNEGLSSTFKAELLADAMHRLGQIPLEDCSSCRSPVFTHEAVRVDGKPYCRNCGARKAGQRSE